MMINQKERAVVATRQGGEKKGIILPIDNKSGYPILLRDPISCMPITRDLDSALGEKTRTRGVIDASTKTYHADMHCCFAFRMLCMCLSFLSDS